MQPFLKQVSQDCAADAPYDFRGSRFWNALPTVPMKCALTCANAFSFFNHLEGKL
jgi:hypothetical protein